MMTFDAAQARVLDLCATQHARVLGAPGTGKTALLVESFARASRLEGWNTGDVLVLASNRLVASQLRGKVERRVAQAMGGTPVRTASSFAFSLLTRHAALAGDQPPRLLTGTVHDEAIAEVVRARLVGTASEGSTEGSQRGPLAPEILESAAFRAELRELARVLDDFGLEPLELRAMLKTQHTAPNAEAFSAGPDSMLQERWIDGLSLLAQTSDMLRSTRPDELSASGMIRRAAELVRNGTATAPRLLLVDDAQELGEGQLALLAACANEGSAIWVFGDPDISTGAFQGERTRVLAGLTAELGRRGWAPPKSAANQTQQEQFVMLDTVYRHGPVIRGLIHELTERIGAMGGGLHRAATSFEAEDTPREQEHVQFARVTSPSEQVGVIAHRMRARKLGLGAPSHQLPWNEMAVVCRSRAEATRITRLLVAHQVPAGIAAGGLVLREHQIVRELIVLLQHAIGASPIDAHGVLKLVGGVIGGLDAVAVRRLRGTLLLEERRRALDEERVAMSIDELIFESFNFPGPEPVIDSAGGRAIRKLGRMAAEGTRTFEAGGTPREVLWALWDQAKLADRLQQEAIAGRGAKADDANRSLDAVLGLFFALQRHEEQDSPQAIEDLLEDILVSSVPEDSLAQQSNRAAVTVTTPQGMVGREFALVAVLGVQEGVWPNLRARGSLLGTVALERWLGGGEARLASRRETVHDELRLFTQACARAREELLVVAIKDDEHHPSPFFGFGRAFEISNLPHSRLTLRGVTAASRKQLVLDPKDARAVRALGDLAEARVPGSHPDDWYGTRPPSSTTALFAPRDGEEARRIPVSPSQLERAEDCALDWVIGSLGGGSGSVQASLGTLVHHALETATSADPDALLAAITAEWKKLPFDAEWESERSKLLATRMAAGLSEYLREFIASDRELLDRESKFSLDIGRAELRGVADRLELRRTPEGVEVTVVDLKTGRTAASQPAAEDHVQLQAYQLGLSRGAFDIAASQLDPETLHTSAKLLYVHPDATRGKPYAERAQTELTADTQQSLIQRVTDIAQVMASGEFTARIEHHCSDPHAPGNCRLHIVQAVSHA
ncbi:MAG: PD-(D/E)XK nuclease family protein [Leucobacter sp.]